MTKMLNYIEICNEIFICITGYFMMIFSEWFYDPNLGGKEEYSEDPLLKYNYGFVYFALISIALVFNFWFILYD